MDKKEEPKRWKVIVTILLTLFVLSWLMASCVNLFIGDSEISLTANVAVIPIKGIILTEGDDLFLDQEVAVSSDIAEFIEQADSNNNIKAILFEIDSPGGTPVASDEIAQAIKKTNKTTVAWIREVGASGAYWAASATDHIVANRMSITGSIGVMASYLEYTGLLKRFNITHQRFVSGKYKDLGDEFRELSPEERLIFQQKIDTLHEYFVEEVALNRNISKQRVREIANGLFYLGSEAKEIGLIDELGSKDEAIRYIEQSLGIKAETTVYEKKKTVLDILEKLFNENSFFVGKGIGKSLTEPRIYPQSLIITT